MVKYSIGVFRSTVLGKADNLEMQRTATAPLRGGTTRRAGQRPSILFTSSSCKSASGSELSSLATPSNPGWKPE